MIRILTLFLLSIPLGSCGLQPLYAPGSSSYGLIRNNVEILPIPGKEGYLVHAQLVDILGEAPAGGEAGYRLQVVLDDDLMGQGLLGNDSITRERRTLRARYRLVDLDNGYVVTDATTGSDAGIDVVSSEYATIAAEDRALENLAAIVAQEIAAGISIAVQSGPESGLSSQSGQ